MADDHFAAQEPASETFMIEHEGHTLANSLRFFLNKKYAQLWASMNVWQRGFSRRDHPHVAFCGYSIPHPAEDVVNIRVQTTGEISAAEALRQACRSLQDVCAHVKSTFEAAVEQKRGAGSTSPVQ